MNSFYLFSEKKKIPPVFKSISSQFADKFKFYFVQSGLEDAEEEFGVIEYPSLYLQLDFDRDGKKQDRQIVRLEGDQDYESIIKFLTEHTSQKSKQEKQEVSRERRVREQKFEWVNLSNYTTGIDE